MNTPTQKPRVILNTGDGKGKTTAALGMILRAVGHGKHVCLLQFIKNDDTVGEVAGLAHLPGVSVHLLGEGFVPKADSPAFKQHVQAAQKGLLKAKRRIEEGNFDLIVLDEICGAVSLGLLEEVAVLDAVSGATGEQTLVLTGRDATPGLLELADTVTAMQAIKHGYQQNFPAQKGVEH